MRFSEGLLIATVIAGVVWAIDSLFLRPKRMMNVLPTGWRNEDSAKEPWWVEYARAFFPILLIVLILRSFVAEPFRIPSGSMRPTLLEGDFIVVNKYDYGLRVPFFGNKILNMGFPERGDVVVFKHVEDGKSIDMIKRVIGVPGDHIRYKDKTLYINGEPVKTEFLGDKMDVTDTTHYPVREFIENLDDKAHSIFLYPSQMQFMSNFPYDDVVVPKDSYFVMGDNRDNSKDSRMWGFVKDEDIQGRAFGIWMSWWGWGWNNIRWNRFFSQIK